jgi:Spy/CpxP family protein refolding chaperone
MYTLRKSLLALAVLIVCAGVARPADEDEKIVAREDAIEVMLLRQASVQQDFKITADEGKKIHEFATRQWRKVRAMKDLSEDERNRKFEAMAKENEQFIKDTLKPEQRKRLNQIAMQVAGLLWVMRSDVAAALNLTDEQKQKIKEAHKEAQREAMEAFRSAGGDAVKEEKFNELRMASRKKLMSILTDAQKAKWKEMAGEKFTGQLHFGPRAEK